MKRIATYFLLNVVLMSSSFTLLATRVYIENHYGAPIKFKTNSHSEEMSVPHETRREVGELENINQLFIRTTGKGSRFVSYFTPLTEQLAEMNNLKNNNYNKDAIIIIKPSRSYQNWDIAIHWETADQKIEIFDEQLIMIMDGSIGDDYAEKARAINDYDYTKSTKGGFINLRTALMKEIEKTTTQIYRKSARRKQGNPFIAPDLSTTEDLKNAINRLFIALQKYKTRDNQ